MLAAYHRATGRVAQWESARFTRERSLVRNQPRPSQSAWTSRFDAQVIGARRLSCDKRTEGMPVSVLTVALIIVFILVLLPILYWLGLGLIGRLGRRR